MYLKTLDSSYNDPAENVLAIIKNTLRSELNTIELCEVVEVNKNKVSVQALTIEKESTHPAAIYHNVIVLIPGTSKFSLEHLIEPGDQGLLLTCKLDISEYKLTKKKSKTTLGRLFDKNDSVFIPLLYNSKDLQKQEGVLKYNNCKITLNDNEVTVENQKVKIRVVEDKINLECQDGDIELICDKVNLNCNTIHCPPIKTAVDALRDLMDSLAAGMTGSATNATQYNANKLTKATDFDSIS